MIAYILRRKDYTNSPCIARLGLRHPAGLFLKEKNNYRKQEWRGERKTERGWEGVNSWKELGWSERK